MNCLEENEEDNDYIFKPPSLRQFDLVVESDGEIDPKALLNVTNSIKEQLVFIASQLNNDVSPRLKNISYSMGSLVSRIEKANPSEGEDNHENKWWRPLRGNRK